MWRGRRHLGALRVLSGVPGVGKSAALAWCCLDGTGPAGPRGRRPCGYRLGARAPRWRRVRGAVGTVAARALLCLDDIGVARTCDPAVVQGLLITRWDAGLVTSRARPFDVARQEPAALGGTDAGDRLRTVRVVAGHDGAPSRGLRAL